jgi:Secretion system C-terminal sorting domain
MRSISVFITVILCTIVSTYAQIAAPQVEAVFGGRILDIATCATDVTESRIFISTESANSVFYADVTHSSSTPTLTAFQVVPAMDDNAGWGAGIRRIGVAETSKAMVFIQHGNNSGLYAVPEPYTTVNNIHAGNVEDFFVFENTLFYTSGPNLYFGNFDASGNFTASSNSPVTMTGVPGGAVQIAVHPISQLVYFLYAASSPSPTLYRSSDILTDIGTTTLFHNVAVSLSASGNFKTIGIAPDGRIFIGGQSGGQKVIAYSDDEITWTDFETLGGVDGPRFAFSGDALDYSVYFASTYSNNKGTEGSWNSFGNPGGWETHPNDGAVAVDPVNEDLVFMTTDQGIGASIDKGATIFEINDGVEAVQVIDIQMTNDKNTAWLASKSGIRRVNNYLTSPTWTNSIFPNQDGSPYHSTAMEVDNPHVAYAGNVRVYKKADNGNSWNMAFTAENAPYNFPGVGSEVRAIEVYQGNPDIVMAGYAINGFGQNGGLFVSEDGGATWNQILLHETVTGQDVDVNDIGFTEEGGVVVAYVGVEHEIGGGHSVYRVEQTSSGWVPAEDMDASGTVSGNPIIVHINDIHITVTGDTIFAVGSDMSDDHPYTYYKALSAGGLWSTITTNGFPSSAGQEVNAIAVGNDTIYCAVDNVIYYFPPGASSWSVGYAYANGTKINFLYFDDLLAGTGTGLYEHPSGGMPSSIVEKPKKVDRHMMTIYPNPSKEYAEVEFELADRNWVELKIYDGTGKEVKQLYTGFREKGLHRFEVDASVLLEGVYYFTLKAGNQVETRMMLKLD